MGFDEVLQFGGEKFKELWLAMEDFWGQLTRGKMDFDEVQHFVGKKFKEGWLTMKNFWGQFSDWSDKVFPPEIRGEKLHHWFTVSWPFPILALVVLIALYYCGGGGGRGGGRVKMMKAPGRNCRMPRNDFEANPKSYFSNLRAHPGDEPC